MHFLRTDDNGEFNLVEFFDDNIPLYAILSHTWGLGQDEVTFEDIVSGSGKSKAGYVKIRFCGEQAARDGLQYFWIDTCCIDKSSYTAINEAINDMFRWYQNSARCYVYLSDVLVEYFNKTDISLQETWEVAFRRSRWFTRGWTLPELIVPTSVEFFSVDGIRLGDKQSLDHKIHEITGIPIQALHGSPMSQFSIVERMSWAANRVTSREEDAAYSLLGIFDIYMPLIYGEGKRSAFNRLQREMQNRQQRSNTTSQYKDWAKEAGIKFEHESRGDLPKDIRHISTTNEFNTDIDKSPDTNSNAGTDIASIFSDGGISTSSASTASLNSVQTTGIREVCRGLLSQEDLKALYTTAVHDVERRKAHAHIRGFLKEYGRNLVREASNRHLETQAAKFVQELAGRIATEISWSITGFEEVNQSLETASANKNLEAWLSVLRTQNIDVEEELNTSGLAANVDGMSEEEDSDEELDSSLLFPNIDKVKDFLLNSEAFRTHVAAMQTWLKVDEYHSRDVKKPAENIIVHTGTEEVTKKLLVDLAASGPDQQQTEHSGKSTTEVKTNLQHDIPHEPQSRPQSRQNCGNVSVLISTLLNFWDIYFFFYDPFKLLVPRVRSGYRRLQWRCSCNSTLWGDFPVDDDAAVDELKRELSGSRVPFTQQVPSGGTSISLPSTDEGTSGPGAIHLWPMHSKGPSTALGGVQPGSISRHNLINVSGLAVSGATQIVNIDLLPKYFEVCINIGNYAIDHHEIDISRVTSDGELFELIWNRYSSSRGVGLRRLFLQPRNVHFVMFSVSRRTQYGAGIHMAPDEFPPQQELDKKRYHYLCPKIQMPVNVFLHYLHRARWNTWEEHTEDTWLQRLPKKLYESVLAEARRDDATNQQDPVMDPNLAFGWGIHILDGPNHAVLSLLLLIGVAVSFFVSGMIVGFAKTQEQGFGVGNFLLAILASIMAAVYFKLQDL